MKLFHQLLRVQERDHDLRIKDDLVSDFEPILKEIHWDGKDLRKSKSFESRYR